jgi:FMN-dependent NADH-azoreductase
VYVALSRGGVHKGAATDTQLMHLELFLKFVGLGEDVQYVFSEGHGMGAEMVAKAQQAANDQIAAVVA